MKYLAWFQFRINMEHVKFAETNLYLLLICLISLVSCSYITTVNRSSDIVVNNENKNLKFSLIVGDKKIFADESLITKAKEGKCYDEEDHTSTQVQILCNTIAKLSKSGKVTVLSETDERDALEFKINVPIEKSRAC